MLRCLLLCCCCLAALSAHEWHVIVLCEAPAAAATDTLQQQADRLNALHEKYEAIKPYFGVVGLRDGRRCLLFGWRDDVQGLRKEDFPRMLDGLREQEVGEARPYAKAYWLDVRELRAQLPGDD